MKTLWLAVAMLLAVAAPGQRVVTRVATATILSGGTVSSDVYVGEYVPVTLQMPAAFTGTSVTFQGSADGSLYQQIYVGGSAYTETVAAGKAVVLSGTAFAGSEWIRVVSNSAEGADRAITVVARWAK